jgi:hypothetical protein
MIRQHADPPGDIELLLRAVATAVDPDPFFRRRLRGVVLNEHVALREGVLRTAAPGRGVMGRLGRACLVTSVVVIGSLGAVGVAAQDALPGDPLHAVKLQIEALRQRVAPAEMRPELAAWALSERIEELERLVDAGRWTLARAAAAEVAASAEDLAAYDVEPTAADAARIDRQLTVLAGLVERVPEPARDAIEHALEVSSGADGRGADPRSQGGSSYPAGGNGGTGSAIHPTAPPGAGGGRPGDDANVGHGQSERAPRQHTPK